MSDIAPPPQPKTSHRLPADYYCAATVDVKPLLPRKVALGCGWASAVFLVLLFGAATFISGGRFGKFMDVVLGMMLGEMRSMYAPTVGADNKRDFEAEVERLRENVRSERLPVARLDPVVKAISEVSSDKTITPDEVERLTKTVRDANRPPTKK